MLNPVMIKNGDSIVTTDGIPEIRRDHIWRWLYEFRGAQGFRTHEDGRETLIDTCCAVLILQGIGRLDETPSDQRESLGQFILGFQDPATGGFLDSRAVSAMTASWQDSLRGTWFALQALDALGIRPNYRFKFLDGFVDRAGLIGWVRGLDWSVAATAADSIAAVLQVLIYRVEVERDRLIFRARNNG